VEEAADVIRKLLGLSSKKYKAKKLEITKLPQSHQGRIYSEGKPSRSARRKILSKQM